MRSLIVILVVALSETSALACSEPSAPFCASSYGAFDDQYEFDRCRSEMESYRSEVDEYLRCAQNEIEDIRRKANNVSDEFNSAVSAFNDRARQ